MHRPQHDRQRVLASELVPHIERWIAEGGKVTHSPFARQLWAIRKGKTRTISFYYADKIFRYMGLEHRLHELNPIKVVEKPTEPSNGNARKLTDDQVRAIRREYAPRPTLKELAQKYGVTVSTVGRIAAGESYQDVK